MAKATSRTRQTDKKKPKYQDVADLDREGRSFVFYGKSGSGKTTLASSFPNALLIDMQDEGTDSVKDVKGLKVATVGDLDEFDDIYWDLYKGDHSFETAIIDTVTMLQYLKIEDIVGEKLKKSGKVAGDWGTMTKQDWGTVAAFMKKEITRWRNLPINIVFLAQQRVFNYDDDSENSDVGIIDPEVGAALSPSVKSHLDAAVNVIGNTFIRSRFIEKKNEKGKKYQVEKIEYCLGLGPSSVFTRKVRKPMSIKLPDLVVDPTYEDLIEIIQGDE